MAEVVAIAVAIGTAVASAATAVAAVVATVATAVASALAPIIAWVWSGITIVYTAVAEALTEFAAGWAFTVDAGFQGLSVAGESFFLQVGAYAGSLVYYFGAFLEAIHFSTLLSIHEIAYIVSDDYRAMWTKVYKELGSVSYALGYSADFLNIIIRDSRNVVLDASAMMGQKYDLAEVTWIKSFQGYMKVFSDQASKYTKNPGAVFYDIDRMLTKPAVDNKAGIMQTVYQTIDSTIKFTKTTVDEVDKLRVDLGTLVSHLPQSARDAVKPMLDKITKGWDEWIRVDYRPSLKVIDGVIKSIGIEQSVVAARQKSLADRLKKPSTYLKEIYDRPSYEWPSEEKVVGDIAARSYSKESQENYQATQPEREEFLSLTGLLERERPKVEWAIPEVKVPERPAGTPIEPRKTWNVGDY